MVDGPRLIDTKEMGSYGRAEKDVLKAIPRSSYASQTRSQVDYRLLAQTSRKTRERSFRHERLGLTA